MSDAVLSLTVAGPAAGRYNSERGYYRYDPMDESFGDGLAIDWETTGWLGGATVPPEELNSPSCVYIEPVKAIIPRPYWNFVSIPFTGNWSYFPVGAVVEDIAPGGNLLDSHLYHFARSNLTAFQGAISRFVLPLDPAFMIHLRRHDLPFDWDWAVEPVTIIYFGQYSLHIPYRRPARLRWRDWALNPEIHDEFDLDLNRTRDAGGEDTVDLTVMSLAGGLLFSTDYGGSWHFYRRYEDPDDWRVTARYYLALENLGGRFSFAFVPIDAPAQGIFIARDEGIGYAPTAGHPVAGGAIQDDRMMPNYGVRQAYDAYTVPRRRRRETFGSIAVTYPAGMAADHCQYQITMTPQRTYQSALGCYFGQFPQLFAVRLAAWPAALAGRTGGGASTIAVADVVDLTVDLSDDMTTDTAVITCQNEDRPTIRAGVNGYENVQEYEQIAVDLQGPDELAATTVFAGYLLRPVPSQSGDDRDEARLECGSPWLLFKDYKCLETDPCLAGWYTEDAIEWYVDACGLPIAFTKHSDYQNKHRKLPAGIGGDRGWQAKPGATAAEMLEQIAAFEDYELYFDGWTLKYEPRPASTQSVDWNLHLSDADSPGAGSLLMLNHAEALRDPEDHRNEVVVIGQDRATDDYLIAHNIDSTQIGASATAVGHRKMLMVVDPQFDTRGTVQRVARKLFDRYSGWPPRRLSATVLGRAAIKRKQAVQVHGAGLRSDHGVFRIETVSHHYRERHFTTQVEAIWIRDG